MSDHEDEDAPASAAPQQGPVAVLSKGTLADADMVEKHPEASYVMAGARKLRLVHLVKHGWASTGRRPVSFSALSVRFIYL